jgi:hypothetical protein
MNETKDKKRTQYRILKVLTEGKTLQASIPESAYPALKERGVNGKAISHYLKDFETAGLIAGYVPVLTEKGKAYFDALKTLYESESLPVEETPAP